MSILLTIGSILVVNAPNFVGFVLPPFVELLNKDVKNDNERYIIAMIVCLLIAMLLHWQAISNGTPQDTLYYAGIIFVESNSVFKLYFANSSFRQSIQNKLNPPVEQSGEVVPPVTP